MLIAIDGPLYEKFDRNMYEVDEYVQNLVKELNQIFHTNVFTKNYNSEIYFRVKEIRLLSGFCPNCFHGKFDNRCMSLDAGNYFLSEFSKMNDTKNFCIAHLLTDKQFVNTNTIFSGFSNKRSICSVNNTGFTIIKDPWFKKSRKLAVDFAHKIAHNFGAKHEVGLQNLNVTNKLPCPGEKNVQIPHEKIDDLKNPTCSWEFTAENRKFDICNVKRMQNYVKELLSGK